MTSLTHPGLTILSPEEMDHVHGSGGELGISFQTPPFRATLDVNANGALGAATGSLSVDRFGTLTGGLGVCARVGRASLEGSIRTSGEAWEVRGTLRIPLGRP